MNSNQLANIDDEHGELDVAGPEGPDAAAGPNGFAGELTGATKAGRSVNTTVVVLGIILVAAGAGIWSMRWVSSATASPDGPTEFERQVAEILPGIRRGFEEDEGVSKPLLVMRDDPTEKQVPVNDVQKNPFFVPQVDEVTTEVAEVVPVVQKTPDELRAERRLLIEQAAEQVRVTSIISGSSPVAIADDRAVRVGDIIDVEDWQFTVESIDATGVTLVFTDLMLRSPVRVLRGITTDDSPSSSRRGGRRPRR
jgi:hypothetical protein